MFRDPPAQLDVGRLHADDAVAAHRPRREMREVPVIGQAICRGVLAHWRHHDAVAHDH